MCGITGFFNTDSAVSNTLNSLETLKNRGKDGAGIAFGNTLILKDSLKELKLTVSKKTLSSNFAIGHVLHSVVNSVKEPFMSNSNLFAANCEIYNWEILAKKYSINAKNDAELLFILLNKTNNHKDILKLLSSLDGVYAFSFLTKDTLYLARDIIGIKPLWYSHSDGFAFSSEKKSLESLGYLDIQELNPRQLLVYDLKTHSVKFIQRLFFKLGKTYSYSEKKIESDVEKLLTLGIKKRIPDKKFGILFSGGIDSTFLAFMCKRLGYSPTLYTAALSEKSMKEAPDLVYSKRIAKYLGLELKCATVSMNQIDKYLKTIVPLIEDTKVTKVSVALTLFLALELAKKDKVKVIFSGLGSEEIFAGYERHKKSYDINKECLSGLLKLYERDTYRDDVISMYNNIEIRLPFLDKSLVKYSLNIPEKYKLNETENKIILRRIALKLGLESEFALRKKVAAQYGSRLLRSIEKLSKQNKSRSKSDFLKRYYLKKNLKLGALISTGKDSLYAAFVMKEQNYDLTCALSLVSDNPSSYMFHTPNIGLVKLQAEAMDIPLVCVKTKGEKEKELKDLKNALKKAKSRYKIDGIITGALYSSYQRDRIEKIADSLGLKVFSPLWHINQETEMKEIVRNNFDVIISSIAAEGLTKSDLGRKIDLNFIERMVKLNEKVGVNIAGEGGEFESLVLDCPLFHKRIVIKESRPVMENENTGFFIVDKALLEEK